MGPKARYTKQIVVRMPHSLHALLKQRADEAGQTMADYIRDALRVYVMQ